MAILPRLLAIALGRIYRHGCTMGIGDKVRAIRTQEWLRSQEEETYGDEIRAGCQC